MALTAVLVPSSRCGPGRAQECRETDLHKLFTVLVRDQNQAVEVCRRLVAEEGLHSVVLCPGNTHRDVAQMVEAVGDGVSVSVARGDGPSMRIVAQAKERAGWFSGAPQT
jgi:hypothetical protein